MLLVLTLAPAAAFAAESNGTHVRGVHSVGVRGGTGWGNTFDVGVTYQYYFARRWSFFAAFDYERGAFNRAGYQGFRLSPGAEFAVWQPTTWLYLHLTGNILGSYDLWDNDVVNGHYQGGGIGLALGFNLEFYALPELSFTLAAQQGWQYEWLRERNTGEKLGMNYFLPLFSLGIKYNIR